MKRAAAPIVVVVLGMLAGPTVESAGTLHFTDRTQAAGFDLAKPPEPHGDRDATRWGCRPPGSPIGFSIDECPSLPR